jgi:hypothetical protein
LFLVQ